MSNFGRLQATAGNHPIGGDAAIFEPQPGEVEQGNFLVDCIVDWGLDDDGEPAAEVKWFRWGHGHNSVVKLNLIGRAEPDRILSHKYLWLRLDYMTDSDPDWRVF